MKKRTGLKKVSGWKNKGRSLKGNRGLRPFSSNYTRNRKNLTEFYEIEILRIKETKSTCEECGCYLQGTHTNVAHIFPKSQFPEIADDQDNILDLCPEHHTQLDNKPWEAENMKVAKRIQAYADILIREEKYSKLQIIKQYKWLQLK